MTSEPDASYRDAVALFLDGALPHADAARALHGADGRREMQAVDALRAAASHELRHAIEWVLPRFTRLLIGALRWYTLASVDAPATAEVASWIDLVRGFARRVPPGAFDPLDAVPAFPQYALEHVPRRGELPAYAAELARFELEHLRALRAPDDDDAEHSAPDAGPRPALRLVASARVCTFAHDFLGWVDAPPVRRARHPAPAACAVLFWRDADFDVRRAAIGRRERWLIERLARGEPRPLDPDAVREAGLRPDEMDRVARALLSAQVLTGSV